MKNYYKYYFKYYILITISKFYIKAQNNFNNSKMILNTYVKYLCEYLKIYLNLILK